MKTPVLLVLLLLSISHAEAVSESEDLWRYKETYELSFATSYLQKKCPDQYNLKWPASSYLAWSEDPDETQPLCHPIETDVAGVSISRDTPPIYHQICAARSTMDVIKNTVSDEVPKTRLLTFQDGSIVYPRQYLTENIPTNQPWYNNALYARRAIVIVVDASYSMTQDGQMEKARELVRLLLDTLTEKDRATLVYLNTEAHYYGGRMVPMTRQNKYGMRTSLKLMYAHGNAQVMPHLRQAYLELNRTNDYDLRSVVFISDGQISLDTSKLNELDQDVYRSTTLHTMSTGIEITQAMKILACYGSGSAGKYRNRWSTMLRFFERESGEAKVVTSYNEGLVDPDTYADHSRYREPQPHSTDFSRFRSLVLYDLNMYPRFPLGVVAIQTKIQDEIEQSLREAAMSGTGTEMTFTLEGETIRFWSGETLDVCEMEMMRDEQCGVDHCILEDHGKTHESHLTFKFVNEKPGTANIFSCQDVEIDPQKICYRCLYNQVKDGDENDPHLMEPYYCEEPTECQCSFNLYRDMGETEYRFTPPNSNSTGKLFDACLSPNLRLSQYDWNTGAPIPEKTKTGSDTGKTNEDEKDPSVLICIIAVAVLFVMAIVLMFCFSGRRSALPDPASAGSQSQSGASTPRVVSYTGSAAVRVGQPVSYGDSTRTIA